MDAVIESTLVPDPSMTDAEFLHRQAVERERADTLRIKPNLDVGKVWADRNRITQIGGLAYIRRRDQHHERAAERFLNLYEARYGRVAPAIDLSKVRVDTSIIGHDGEMVTAIDATDDIQFIEHGDEDHKPVLNRDQFSIVVAIVCLGSSVSDFTGLRGRALDSQVTRLLDALDLLAVHWGMLSKKVA